MIKQEFLIEQSVIQKFKTLKKNNRMAHAYLFVGPRGSGKKETSVALAKALNCEEHAKRDDFLFCDRCPACMKMNTEQHPDVHMIDNGFKEKIKIEQIRGIISQMRLMPFMSERKMFIINHIENFTLESSNALLKTLEEPSAKTLLILTTSVPEKILATIKSRCHPVAFHALPNSELAKRLNQYYDESILDAKMLSHFSDGSLGKAVELKEKNFLALKDSYLDEFLFSYDSENFIKKLLADKENIYDFLNVLFSWVRDAILVKAGVEDERLIHQNRIQDIHMFQIKFTFQELNDLSHEITRVYKLVEDNFNLKIPLLIIKEKLHK